MQTLLATSRKMLCLLFLFPLLPHAQVIQTTGKNLSVNEERMAGIDGLIQNYINHHWLNGAVTLVVKDNQVVQYKAYGYADAAAKKLMQRNSLFRIASQTKAITAVSIMQLYEQGKLLLDEPVSDFIPAYKNMTVLKSFHENDTTYTTEPAKKAITIRDLLTHTSGLDYPGIGSAAMKAIYAKAGIIPGFGLAKKGETLLDAMNVLAKLPLVHQPGEKWNYGLNYDLLGCLIEVISGEPLNEYCRKNIFEPVGMKDTYFNVPEEKATRLATVYTEDSLHNVVLWEKSMLGVDPNYPLEKKMYFSGGADLTSTAMDYAAFLQMLLNGGTYNGHILLSPRTVEMMTSNQLNFSFNGENDFGLGFEIVSTKGAAHGPRNNGSFAWGGFWGSAYWADPKAHLIGIIMTQQTPNNHADMMQKVQDIIYASLKN
ncbi:serine hydrolase domain-containing protein [Hydrotalea sp.]|uniref:serine hydrolase domain-containing protein n=1 Tax=Hydrotalea sp. TaxID=2881279 RepID=UPI00262F241A|nr:serine hydrolase domain-containing protein [Hydrotalea sp.]